MSSLSSTIVTCECGTKVRIAPDAASRSLRCPKCKTGLAVTSDAAVLKATSLAVGEESVCPICQTSIGERESCVTCPGCEQVHHRECWAEIGGCGTYGCREAPAAEKPQEAVDRPLTAWGDTKRCPACGETIKSIALRCRYCGTDFHSVDPLSVDDLRAGLVADQRRQSLRRNTVVLFVMSLTGFLAPISALAGLAYLLPRRRELSKSGPLFAIMGWTSLALSAFYTLLLIIFIVLGW